MRHFGLRLSSGLACITLLLLGLANGQATPAQSIVSAPTNAGSSEDATGSTGVPDIAVDPASLLPDLPSLPKTNASLVGGMIAKVDRVRDQLTVAVFGGGKMKVAFDTRTRIFHD